MTWKLLSTTKEEGQRIYLKSGVNKRYDLKYTTVDTA